MTELLRLPSMLPPQYFLISTTLTVGVSVLLGRGLIGGWFPYVGLIPMMAGAVFAVEARRQFAKVGTNIIPLSKSSKLMTEGMFRFSRNPMYLGAILLLAGLVLVMDVAAAWLILAIFTLILRQKFVLKEEKLMEETFGHDYLDYKAKVRRWL